MKINADVIYKVNDPTLAVKDIDDIENTIMQVAEMNIAQVVRCCHLNNLITAAGKVGDEPVQEGHGNPTTLLALLSELVDKVKSQLGPLGIELINIGIKSWEIIDQTLARELGQGAVIQSQANSRLLTAEQDAKVLNISAQAEADAVVKKATGEAEAHKIEAESLAKTAEIINGNSLAGTLAEAKAQAGIVGAAKPGTTLFYGSVGRPGFFQKPLANETNTGASEPRLGAAMLA